MACIALLGGLGMEWRSVKKQHKPNDETAIEEGKDQDDKSIDDKVGGGKERGCMSVQAPATSANIMIDLH
jgi:hypothetical protein